KTGLHVTQHVLRHPKIDSDAVTIPYLLLPGGEAVRATTDDEPQLLGPSDHFYSHTAGWIAEFHGAVDVKADEKSQLSSSSRLPSANMASHKPSQSCAPESSGSVAALENRMSKFRTTDCRRCRRLRRDGMALSLVLIPPMPVKAGSGGYWAG